ncbi:MAG: T9SS type A sorting domain-containing protein [bacterium]|nr:T9SS type A sorting domain-containing protein [bacterium]
MKRIIVVTGVLIISNILFAMPVSEVLNRIHKQISVEQNDFISFPKDSYAIAAGMKGILHLGGDFRGFAPSMLKSINVSFDGQAVQVISGKYSGATFEGVYYTVSLDGGATWSIPELISSASPLLRCYSEITASSGDYPYVVMNYRTNDYIGVWFTRDSLGAGQSGWSQPSLISDTILSEGYLPSIAVNRIGDKVAFLSRDMTNGFGSNYSTDYGLYWHEYGLQNELNTDTVKYADISCIRFGKNDTVFGFFGMTWKGEKRSDVNASGVGTAILNGYSYSTDGGASWSISQTPMCSPDLLPDIPSINGDTFYYYLDTIKGNFIADSLRVAAYLDTITGFWKNSLGEYIGDEFGTWWYWWDAQYFGVNGSVCMAVPISELFVDYYVGTSGDLYTFIWQGQSILFYLKDDINNKWEMFHFDVHDGDILDSTGKTATWKGNPYSANITYSPADDSYYIIYLDYADTATGENSLEALKINLYCGMDPDDPFYRYVNVDTMTLISNIAAYTIESSQYVDFDGYIHIAASSNSQDSIYYKKIYTGQEWYMGMENAFKKTIEFNNGIFLTDDQIIWNAKTRGYLTIYDVSGRKIMSEESTGKRNNKTNISHLKNGVYFIKLQTPDQTITEKMVRIK